MNGEPARRGPDGVSRAASAVGRVRPRVAVIRFDPRDDPRAAEQELGRFCFRWLLAVLGRMGVMRRPNETYDVEQLRRTLNVAPKYHRYFDALLRKLAAEGFVVFDGRQLSTTPLARQQALEAVDREVAEFRRSFEHRYPGSVGLLNLAAATLERFDEILTGRVDVAEVLFKNGEGDLFGAMFRGNAVADYFNRIVADAVRCAVLDEGARPAARGDAAGSSRTRVLELGAGTGGTTAAILEALEPHSAAVEFVFTDISRTFLRAARRRFESRYPWVEYRTLNIEEELSRQGFEPHQFDVVVAANVLHDTRDIDVTLTQTARLLRPGGLLVLDEFTAVKDCLFFIGALLHGYWLFEDPARRRPDTCLLAPSQWRSALARTGFSPLASYALPTQTVDDDSCSQSVMLCEAPAAIDGGVAVQLQSPASVATAALGLGAADAASDDLIGDGVERSILSLLGPDRVSAYHPRRPLRESGLDSIELVELKALVEAEFAVTLPATFLFEHETQEKVAAAVTPLVSDDRLRELRARSGKNSGESAQRSAIGAAEGAADPDEAVAIVGVACRFPGGVSTLDEFWAFLDRGASGIRPLPSDRWEWPSFVDVDGKHKGIDRGGFLDSIDAFDAQFFRTSPKEAELMDPQQRLLLELSWEALEDAGHRPSELSGRNVGVFVGACHGDYRDLLTRTLDSSEAYAGTGTAFSVLSNRLSYFYNFNGASITVDTACSSSLFAVHSAITAIRRGECEQALAGAVNVMCSPATSLAYYQAGMLSRTGTCRTFDAAADGYVRGEGGAMLLLKPLSRARTDGDAIYAVFRGTAVNHGGQTASLTAPSPSAQASVIEAAWLDARIPPDTVDYIETHGTGTRLGDPIEIAGLVEAFRRLDQHYGTPPRARPHCALGAVKTNVGHLEAAAGMAGVLKVLAAMHYGRIPGSLNFERLNPDIALAGTPFYVQDRSGAWPLDDAGPRRLPRRAGVSSFGSGGANAHVVLEQFVVTGHRREARGPQLVPLSAKSRDRLVEQARRLLAFVERATNEADEVTLSEIAFTLQVGREEMEERAAFVADGVDALAIVLRRFVDGDESVATCYRGSAPPRRPAASAAEQARIQAALAAGDANTLGSLWVTGARIDWQRLHADAPPRRLRLPTYPFARTRHWLRSAQPLPTSRVVHPLLARQENADGTHFSCVISGDEPFVADHRIGGRHLLPAVVYLEMARAGIERRQQASDRTTGDRARDGISLRNVVWRRPFSPGNRPARLHLELSTVDRDLAFEVYTISDETGAKEVYAVGRGSVGATRPAEAWDLRELQTHCSTARYSADDCYQAFAARGFHYGPSLRRIAELMVGSDLLLARIAAPAAPAGADPFVLDPAVADAAMQATIAFSVVARGTTDVDVPVPFELESMEVLGDSKSAAWVVVRRDSGRYHVDVCDASGATLVRFTGLSTRPLGRSSAAAPRAEPATDELLAVPVWQPLSVPPFERSISPATALAVIGGTAAERAALRQAYPSATFLSVEADSSIEAIRSRLEANQLDHLVWIVPRVENSSGRDESVVAEKHAALFGFRLVKGLLAAGYGERELTLTMLTAGGCAVGDDRSIAPSHAGVHGLAGSLAKEQTRWQVRVTDLPASDDWPWDGLLDVPHPSEGNALAYRDRVWYRQQLVEHRPPEAVTPLGRAGEVYVIVGGAGGIGAAWSEALIRRAPVQLVWIGRRPQDAAIEDRIAALGRYGPAPMHLAADASDADELARARAKILRSFGRVDALVHAAVVLNDRSLANMSSDGFESTLAAKVDVCVRIEQVFRESPPPLVLFFSSVNALAKPAGQANYAAGCAFKDAFARRLAAEWPSRVRTVNWGYWGDVGVAASLRHRTIMTRKGFGAIDLSGATRVLDHLASDAVEQLAYVKTAAGRPVGALDLGLPIVPLSPSRAIAGEERRQPIADRSRTAARSTARLNAGELIRESRDAATAGLLEELTRLAAETLGMDAALFDAGPRPFVDTYLGEFGIDSLSSTTLRDRLRSELSVDLAVQQIIEEPVGRIVELLYEQLLVQHLSRDDSTDTADRETYVF